MTNKTVEFTAIISIFKSDEKNNVKKRLFYKGFLNNNKYDLLYTVFPVSIVLNGQCARAS